MIFKLRKLDLELAFTGSSTASKDIENQACSIDDLCLECFREVLGLTGRKILIDDDDVNAFDQYLFTQLLDLALANECRRIRAFAPLYYLVDNPRTGRFGQLTQ